MHQLINLLKTNPFARFALLATAVVGVLILVFSPRRSSTPAPIPVSSPLPSTIRPELLDLEEQKIRAATEYRQSIEGSLPIYLENFPTSVDINTTINIYYLPSDPNSTVRFEIYGLSYLNSDSSQFTNPNVTAFKESFEKGLSLMRERGLDPDKLIFIYGDKEYVRITADTWVQKLGLLR